VLTDRDSSNQNCPITRSQFPQAQQTTTIDMVAMSMIAPPHGLSSSQSPNAFTDFKQYDKTFTTSPPRVQIYAGLSRLSRPLRLKPLSSEAPSYPLGITDCSDFHPARLIVQTFTCALLRGRVPQLSISL
jgi:hypothetical protein